MGMTPEYLLGMIDADGRKRPSAPIIVRGDAKLLRQVIAANPHKRKYTSGLMMDEKSLEQLGGRNFLEKLMDDFERVMFPGIPKDSFVIIFVIHPRLDKKLEINYCVANLHLPSGKNLKPYFDKIDRRRFSLFMEQQNLLHGMSNPNDPERRKSIRPNPRLPKGRQAATKLIHNCVEHAIKTGRVSDRESLIKFLENTYQINRQGVDYISIRDSSGRLLRLKGGYYCQAFKAGVVVPKIPEDPKQTRDRLTFVSGELERLCSLRSEKLTERYKPKSKEKKQNDNTNQRQSLRGRIFRKITGITQRARSLVREIAERNRTRAERAQRTTKISRGADQQHRAQGSAPLARDYFDRRSRRSTSDTEAGISSYLPDHGGTERRDNDEVSSSHDGVALFARFLRFFPQRVRRLQSRRGDAAGIAQENLQDPSPKRCSNRDRVER